MNARIAVCNWIIALLIGSCSKGVGLPATEARATVTPGLAATTSSTPSATTDALLTQTPPAPRLPFSDERASTHRLAFTLSSETSQTVYLYDHEIGRSIPIYTLPSEISLYEQAEEAAILDPATGSPIRGLGPLWMRSSPDGKTLAALQPGAGGHPNYIHQIDLNTGDVLTIKILEDYQWTLPIVPGRVPRIERPEEGEASDWDDASDVFRGFHWAPDSSGFAFVLGAYELDEPEAMQTYYVRLGSREVIPLAAETPGLKVGSSILDWSPNGRRLLYWGDPLLGTLGLWLIDLDQPGSALRLTDHHVKDFATHWASDSRVLFFEFDDGNGDALYQMDTVTNETRELLTPSVPPSEEFDGVQPVEDVVMIPFGYREASGTLLVFEVHRMLDRQTFRYTFDASRSKLHLLDLVSGTATGILPGVPISGPRLSPADPWLHLSFVDADACAIVTIPEGGILYGPEQTLCDVIDWSPDGHMLAGAEYTGLEISSIVVFDLDSEQRLKITEGLEGDIDYYGWLPDPSVFDELLAGLLP